MASENPKLCRFTPAHPLTSPSSCTRCVRLSQRIGELEGSIKLKKMNSSSIPWLLPLLLMPLLQKKWTPRFFVLTLPQTQAGDHWTQLRARPKALISSTPCQTEPWIVACGNKRCGRRSSGHPPPWDLKLDNMFSILDEVEGPSLENYRHPPSPTVHLAGPLSHSLPSLLRRAGAVSLLLSKPRISPAQSPSAAAHLLDHGLPTSLIIADSIDRNIRTKSAVT